MAPLFLLFKANTNPAEHWGPFKSAFLPMNGFTSTLLLHENTILMVEMNINDDKNGIPIKLKEYQPK